MSSPAQSPSGKRPAEPPSHPDCPPSSSSPSTRPSTPQNTKQALPSTPSSAHSKPRPASEPRPQDGLFPSRPYPKRACSGGSDGSDDDDDSAGGGGSSLRISRYMSSDVPPADLGTDLGTALSLHPSTSLGPPVPVPSSHRRGLVSRFCLVSEITDPHTYSNSTKWLITLIVAIAGSAAPMGSAVVMPAVHDIAADLSASPTVTNLSVALYMLSMSIFPLWWSSLSEKFGRRSIYIVSFVLFTVFAILSAVSTNIAMLVVMRSLSGGAAASVQAVGAGTISDVWESQFRGRALGIFYIGPLCGPLIAPIMGGAMTQSSSWRITQWFLAAFGGALTIMIIFALPETLPRRRRRPETEKPPATRLTQPARTLQRTGSHGWDLEKDAAAATSFADRAHTPTLSRPSFDLEKGEPSAAVSPDSEIANPLSRVPTATTGRADATSEMEPVSTRQSIHDRATSTAAFLGEYVLGPLKIVLLLRFPPVLLTVLYASIAFGALYVLNISIVNTFSKPPYDWSTLMVGLCYIPNGVGFILASVLGGRWLDYVMRREAIKAGRRDHRGRLAFLPEDRMQENVWVAATLFPAALLCYGWSAERSVHWAVLLMANFFFGFGAMLVFGTSTTMLTEFMPAHPSHGVALNNFVRNIFSCVGTLVAHPVLTALGNGKLMSVLAGVCLLFGYLTIALMRRYSKHWRQKYGDQLGK